MSTFRKYGKTAAMELTSQIDGSLVMVLGKYGLRLLRVLVLLALWRTIFAGKETVSGMSVDVVLTYTLVAAAFEEQLNCRTDASLTLWMGDIVGRFMRPMSVFGQFSAQAAGRWVLSFALFSVPLLLGAPLLGVSPFPAGLSAGLWFLPSLGLAVCVGLAIEFIFVALMVRWDQGSYATTQIRDATSMLLSGALIPLALYPWGVGRLFAWLPFACMASAPLRIFTGTGSPVQLVGIQLAWTLMLWPLALWMWRANRERLVSHGG